MGTPDSLHDVAHEWVTARRFVTGRAVGLGHGGEGALNA
jgi:hypothetical protein